MKKIIYKSIFILILLLCCVSCKYDFSLLPRQYDIETRSPDFTDFNSPLINKAPENYGEKFSVLLIADTHFGRNGYFCPPRNEEPFYTKIENLFDSTSGEYKDYPPAFTIHMGDNSDTGKLSEFEQFNELQKKISEKLKAVNPDYNEGIYSVVGNHDLYNNGWAAWKNMTFPETSTYYFKTTGSGCSLSWYFLDSGSGILGNNQIEKLNNLTKADSNQKVMISHYPVNVNSIKYYSLSDPLEVAKLSQIYCNSKTKWTFEGHYHPGGTSTQNDKNGNLLFNEQVIRGFVDKQCFSVMTVDLRGSEPVIEVKNYKY